MTDLHLLPFQELLIRQLASPRIIRKTRAVGPSWMNTTEIVSGIVDVTGFRTPLTAGSMTEVRPK